MELIDSSTSRNRRAAKNAIMLAIRMIIVTLIGLYTSRIVLNTLGVIDYGVYGVAGSFIGMISFLNSSMAGATNRFLCIEMGHNNELKLQKVFNSAFIIHVIIAFIILIISETIGLWFLNSKLNIPQDRMFAANCVFQCSVFSVLVSITQTPYSAIILAREKMSIYAYFEILNVGLKLLIIAVLIVLPGDKLIIYAILVASVSVIMQTLYRIYCLKYFPESKIKFGYHKEYLKPMFNYSLTDLYGNVCIIGYEQSRPILINMFFGVIYNAALSLAYTVQTMISSLATNVTLAFKPQILKLYAQGDISNMQQTMENAIKFTTLTYAIISIPCIFETSYILNLWLGEVPPHTVAFLKIIIITSSIATLSGICCIAIHATGRIKSLTYITGSLYIAIPIITWVLYKNGANAICLFFVYGIAISIITIVDLILVKLNICEFKVKRFVKYILLTYLIITLSVIPILILKYYLYPSFLRLALTCITYSFTLGFFVWLFILDSQSRVAISNYIKLKFSNR